MAEITCCTGQTECNRIITIGYLKSFIGNEVKNTGGTTVFVSTTKPDSYEPVYSELASGTLIPLFVDGGENKWHSNIDGITVKGTYAANQCVKQSDLVLTYTRYKSLTIDASNISFSECGDSSNISATYKLTKTVKAMNDNCVVVETSSDGYDTTCKPSFSRNCDWLTFGSCSNNAATATAGKNGTWSSPPRNCNINASVLYKGQTYTSNVLTINQRALEGSYNASTSYKDRYWTNLEITDYSTIEQERCDSYSVTAKTTEYYYDRYRWVDSCGEIYEYNYHDVTGSTAGPSDSYTFSSISCPISSQTRSHTMSFSAHGHSDSITFYQICNQVCCDCNSFGFTYSQLPSWQYNEYESKTNTFTADTTCLDTSNMAVSSNTSWFTATQNGNGIVVTPSGVNNEITAKTGTISVTYKKDGTDCPVKTFTVRQEPYECGCGDLTVGTPPNPWNWNSTDNRTVSYTANTKCVTISNITSSNPWFIVSSSQTGSIGTITIHPSGNNTSDTSAITATITVDSYSNGKHCPKYFEVTQKPNACTCEDLSWLESPSAWSWDSTTAKAAKYAINTSCVSITSVESSDQTAFVFVSTSITNNTLLVNVRTASQNITASPKTATMTVNYRLPNGGTCYKTFNVTQNPPPECDCGKVIFGEPY